MPHLPQAAVSRVGHQDMAHRPCSLVASVPSLADPVLVAGNRGEHAEPPLEGRLVSDTAQFGRAFDGSVVAHESDEGDAGGERLAAVLEDGAREGGEPPAAAVAGATLGRRPRWTNPSRRCGLHTPSTQGRTGRPRRPRRACRRRPRRGSASRRRFL